jgi:hypothetical protein
MVFITALPGIPFHTFRLATSIRKTVECAMRFFGSFLVCTSFLSIPGRKHPATFGTCALGTTPNVPDGMPRVRSASVRRAAFMSAVLASILLAQAAWGTTQDVWIAVRTDGQPGSGTQADPYDGSTPQKFDTLMQSFANTSNLGVHLMGSGPFQTYATHTWFVRTGWTISGDGMSTTIVQMVGDVSGIHYGVSCFISDPNLSSDGITIKNLTIDCNWPELSLTADIGAGGEKNIKTGAIVLYGSNNLVDHVRAINSYGSLANRQEQFCLDLQGSRHSDATNNVIQYCRAEQPQGNYGFAFALAGWRASLPYHILTNSKVIGCTAVGPNNGMPTGFATSGVSFANVKDSQVDRNTFIDCAGVGYTDTGTIEGLSITNNTVVRGWSGVGLMSTVTPKGKIEISGNTFNIQNRARSGLYATGIYLGETVVTNITISNNTITFDTSGHGLLGFWGIGASPVNNALIYDNTIGPIDPNAYVVYNAATGTSVILSNNKQPNGSPINGL